MATMTYTDVIQHLVDYLGGNEQDATQREIRRAAISAYRELIDCYPWRALHKLLNIPLNANHTTGTVEYDLTGGSSERLWTFSSATLPDWAARGKLLVGSNSWPIQRRLSSSTLQSPSDFYPAEDIAAGTTFELYQSEFVLPEDFRSMHVGMPTTTTATRRISIQDMSWMGRQNGASGSPWGYSIVADRFLPGRQTIILNPWPASADTFQALYRYRPRDLMYSGYAARDRSGTVSLSGTTVTGSGTAFEAGMEGAVIRISANATQYPSDQAGDNPFYFEGVIDRVTNSSTLSVISNASGVTTSATRYTISDPIALPPSMLNALLRCCEKQAEIVRQRDDGGKQSAMGLFMDALETAQVADRNSFDILGLLEQTGYNHPEWLQSQTRPADIE